VAGRREREIARGCSVLCREDPDDLAHALALLVHVPRGGRGRVRDEARAKERIPVAPGVEVADPALARLEALLPPAGHPQRLRQPRERIHVQVRPLEPRLRRGLVGLREQVRRALHLLHVDEKAPHDQQFELSGGESSRLPEAVCDGTKARALWSRALAA
jgi:hypothetical protein